MMQAIRERDEQKSVSLKQLFDAIKRLEDALKRNLPPGKSINLHKFTPEELVSTASRLAE